MNGQRPYQYLSDLAWRLLIGANACDAATTLAQIRSLPEVRR